MDNKKESQTFRSCDHGRLTKEMYGVDDELVDDGEDRLDEELEEEREHTSLHLGRD